ncbi:MAG: hypothetical protein ABIP95_14515, partial [Pelobium sp.]
EKLLRNIGVENRAQFISYLFEKTAAAYLNMAKRSPWHPKQKPRAVSIIWIYCNHPKEVDATALHALVDFAALLTKEENNILSLAPNQFMLLLLYYLQSQTKESLDHLKLILKVAGRTKIEEALQYYLILAGRHLRLDKFESLLCFLKENKSPFAPYLAMILALSQSATSDKDQFLSFSAVQDTGHSNNLKSHLAPAYHVLKEYLTQLFYALRGHEIMNHADPFALFNIDEEISSSYRNLLKYAPLRF